jgi:hypothetical protein
MGPKSYNVLTLKAGKACQGKALKIKSVVNTVPGRVFTTLYFLCKLRMDPKS